jgi:hypothetical protein
MSCFFVSYLRHIKITHRLYDFSQSPVCPETMYSCIYMCRDMSGAHHATLPPRHNSHNYLITRGVIVKTKSTQLAIDLCSITTAKTSTHPHLHTMPSSCNQCGGGGCRILPHTRDADDSTQTVTGAGISAAHAASILIFFFASFPIHVWFSWPHRLPSICQQRESGPTLPSPACDLRR